LERLKLLGWRRLGYGLLALAFMGIVASLAVAKLQRSSYDAQLANSYRQLEQRSSALQNLRPPKTVVAGQKDLSARNLVEQAAELQKAAQSVKQLPPAPLLYLAKYPSYGYGQIRQADSSAARAHAGYGEFSNYHHATTRALLPLLEYNPQADLGDQRLNNDLIKARIDAARSGLETVYAGLELSSSTQDNGRRKAELLDSVARVQNALEAFASDMNREAWYAAVATGQAAVLANRQDYYEQQQVRLQQLLTEARQQLAAIRQ